MSADGPSSTPSFPVREPLAARLADDLRMALGQGRLDALAIGALEAALRKAQDGWRLSMSGFLRLEDEIEALLTGAQVGRPLVEAVLSDLEDVFLAMWDRSTPASVPPALGAALRPATVRAGR
jgi:hypothetical protein